MRNAIRLEREEMFGTKLGANPTPQEVETIIGELKNKRKINELDSFATFEHAQAPSYYNRYFCGQIVAEVWMDRYEHATRKQQKAMLNGFTCYLNDNRDASIDGACSYLLGMDLNQTVTAYTEIRKNESTLTKARDRLHTETRRTKNYIKNL